MGLASSKVEAFRKAFEIRCVTLLVSAYRNSIADHHYSTDCIENDFTSMLVNYMDKNPQRLTWNIHCHRDHHLYKRQTQCKKGYANKEDIIDMRLSNISQRQEYCFYVEAKRLKEKDSGLLNRYIDTGIDHYLSGKYPQGILLGYLVDGGIDNTVQKVNGILKKNNRDSEILVRKQHPIYNQYFESTHSGFGVISHFVFDFTV